MKKLLAILFTISLAYITSYYTVNPSSDKEPLSFDNNNLMYKVMCFISGETDTTDANSLYKRADDFYYYKEYESAIKDYKKIIQLDSSFYYLNFNIADCYLALNDTTNALKTLIDYSEEIKYNDIILNKIAEIYIANGDFNRAEANLINAISVDSSNHLAMSNLAKLSFKKGEYQKALDYINKAIDISNKNTEYLNIRRKLYLTLNKTELANRDFLLIKQLDSYFFPDYTLKARTANDEGDKQTAVNYYKLALELYPNNKDNLKSRGWIYEELGKYDSAYYDFDLLIKLESDNYYNYFSRAYILDRLDSIEESIRDYTESIKYNEYYLSYNNRGYEYSKIDKNDEAVKDYTKSIEIKSDYYLPYLNRGLIFYDNEKYEEAISDYKNALANSANNANIIYNLAIAYDKLGDKQNTISYFNEYLRLKENIDSTKLKYVKKRLDDLSE